MDKNINAERFGREFVRLNETEKNEFSRLANKMLAATFLCAERENDRKDYYAVLHKLSLYQDYFSIMDYEVINYTSEKVIQLYSRSNANHFKLKLNESVFLLILRKLYAIQAKDISLTDNIIVSMEQIHDSIAETGYFQKRINKTDLKDYIALFKRFSLVDTIGDVDKDDSMIILYPSLLHAAPYHEITEIDQAIRNYRGVKDNENADEDIID